MILYVLTNQKKKLSSFKNIHRNEYHIKTINVDNIEYYYTTSFIYNKEFIMEKLLTFSFGLQHTTIKLIELYDVVNQKFIDSNFFIFWHDRLGHPGASIMHRIIKDLHGHPLKN